MIASLGMYDRAETAAANDALWAAIREGLQRRGIAAPAVLTREDAAYWPAWQSPDLLLSQTCGFPYRARLHGKVTLIGTPDYGLPDCPPGYYCSVFVARATDSRALPEFREAAFAYNEALSQSGWAAPQNHAASMGFQFRPALETGAHRLSAQSVAEGRAEIAALDAVTWALLQRYEPWAGELREVGRTAPTPGLPLITAAGRDPAPIFAAVAEAIDALPAETRAVLHLRGLGRIAPERYLAIPIPPTPEQIAQSL